MKETVQDDTAETTQKRRSVMRLMQSSISFLR